MHSTDRQKIFARRVVFVSIALLLAVRPAAGWQFRDVTDPDEDANAPRVAMAPTGAESSPESAASPDKSAASPDKSAASPDNRDDSGEVAEAEVPTTSDEIRPIRFNKVASGLTTADELKQLWGEP